MEKQSNRIRAVIPSDQPIGAIEGLLKFIDLLTSIDTSDSLAELNETTISDNNGGRIEL